MKTALKKIAIIGNGGGGKTTLSRKLEKLYNLPLTHVDSIQFAKDWKRRDSNETSKILTELSEKEAWIIDGFGSMEVMKDRFLKADKVLFVDFPLWRHYWWCAKRQIKSIKGSRSELPEGCNEATISHTVKLFKILWFVHKKIRPELILFFQKDDMKSKVKIVTTLKEWNNVFQKGL